jgi:post-segregation antitoxin (ccd killing protein)
MSKKLISFRLPLKLLSRLAKRAKQMDVTMTAIVEKAIIRELKRLKKRLDNAD